MDHGSKPLFDSVIVVTDRRVLDKQIRDTIKQFAQVSATVGHAENSGDLRKFLKAGKKIIITTVQKFPFILDEIGDEHRGSKFAIIIDEAHSSQGGRTSAKMNIALAGNQEDTGKDEEETVEDKINKIMEDRKMLPNASYFAFTATPKNRTLEIFGEPAPQSDGTVKHYPFHSYTMKQAIQEGFILDVLKNYTPVESYYRLAKTVEDDPFFDAKKAQKKLRRYVESHEHAIHEKAEIMVDHFHEQVIGHCKADGKTPCATTYPLKRFTIKRQTVAKRLRAKLKEAKQLLRSKLHDPIPSVGKWLGSVVQGHMNYYAVPGNIDSIDTFRTQVARHWFHALRRRSQRHRMPWSRFCHFVARYLPKSRIVHPYPYVRFHAIHSK